MAKKLCGTNYPVSIAFVVVNEFCERFSYYGMKAVLTLYFMNYLHWDPNLSTSIYHAFSSLCYFTPVLGAIIADSWLGKFKTIIYLSIVYVIGHVVKSVGAIPMVGDSTMHIVLSMSGLILIAFGTGGIKPCVAAFGGDQFDEEHVNERRKFFSIFYLSINAGSLLSTVITPLLRADVQCFGGDCYALAFGVPAALMVVALVVFISGSSLYKKNPPEGNVLLDVCKCIGFALKSRWRNRKYGPKRTHWLDWAEEKYSKRLIQEIKMTLRVLVLYIPLPMFWALFDQQGSRWTLQTTRMNMTFGGSLVMKPDQMQMLNALLIILFIPVFDLIVYPLVGLCRINLTPLRKMAAGMIIAALAFCAAAMVELSIVKTVVEPAPPGECLLQVYNLAEVDLSLNVPGNSQPHPIAPYEDPDGYQRLSLGGHNKSVIMEVNTVDNIKYPCTQMFTEQKAYSLLLSPNSTGPSGPSGIQCKLVTDRIEKEENGDAYLRFINTRLEAVNVTVGHADFHILGNSTSASQVVSRGEYTSVVVKSNSREFTINLGLLDFGTSYTVVLKNSTDAMVRMEDVQANDVHIGWQIPQYVLITAGEVMFSITGLEFSYSQAPANMKSVLQAGWLMTVAFGNIIVPVVAAGGLVQWMEFLLFAGLLVAVCIIFSIMSYFYTYADPDHLDQLFHKDDFKKIRDRDSNHNDSLEQSTKM